VILFPGYLLGIAWLCWWVLKRDGTWREAAALFFSPIAVAIAAATALGRLPWIFFIVYAHLTALVFLPIYWALRRTDRLSVAFPLFVGVVSGVVTAFAIRSWMPPGKEILAFTGMGFASGLLFWLIAFFQFSRIRTTD